MTYTRVNGQIIDLPKRNVDTGMGLGRTLAALNGVASPYETSAFRPIIEALLAHTKHSEAEIRRQAQLLKALLVIADHLRTAVFVIGDPRGTAPSNTGAGYVLRRLIRRAIRYCDPLGIEPADWADTHETVIQMFEQAYPELRENAARIERELNLERKRFEQTLKTGMRQLTREIQGLKAIGAKFLSGEAAFQAL
jgi:alanyl-tRNA synthetase